MAEVHNLRTHARRVEAIAAALMPGGKKQKQRLLKTIRPVRKAAGVVRDMDVLARNARTLARHRRNGSVARLLAYLSSMRLESARELFEAVAERRSDARRRLKRFSRQIEKRFHENKPQAAGDGPGTEAAMKLIRELNSWPGFSAENLHAFRIKMTELRYQLQLARDANRKFVDALGEVKEKIGDWHDWQQLAKTAEKVLDAQDDRATLKKIDETGKKKLIQALAAADAIRARYLSRYAQAGTTKTPEAASLPE
jgi:CHAD domain-containing protein